jgi:uncharacterized repeat protein (TIGR02543 family)
MRKKIKNTMPIMLTLVLVTGLMLGFLGWQVGQVQAAGTGTVDDPIMITTAQQLDSIRNGLTLHYRLGNNIDLSSYPNWAPIGTYASPFTGSLDGKGYTIARMTSNRDLESYVGLFGSFSGKAMNLHLTDVNVTGGSYVGGLLGYGKNATVENCTVNGIVNGEFTNIGGLAGSLEGASVIKKSSADVHVIGNASVGGLIGFYSSSTPLTNLSASGDVVAYGGDAGGLIGEVGLGSVMSSHASGDVSGNGNHTGGLIGKYNVSSGKVSYSYASGNVQSHGSYAGGLVGFHSGNMEKSYATGTVSSDEAYSSIGGLIGATDLGSVLNCYATGQVTGSASSSIGGLVGNNGGHLQNNYSIGKVVGGSSYSSGGLVGEDNMGISNSYYNRETSGKNDVVKGNPKTTTEMKTAATFAGWDFNNVWSINEGVDYPKLRPLTYSILYGQNGSISGNVPMDASLYPEGSTATVLGNTGGLARPGYVFAGWNTEADGSGRGYAPGSILVMGSSNITLYAQWTKLTYTIDVLEDQTLAPLAEGYLPGMQETRTITVTRSGTGDLLNLKAVLNGRNADSFIIGEPAATTLDSATPFTTFTLKAKDNLTPDIYSATITISADHLADATFNVEQTVNASEIIKGDANGDKEITAADGLLLTKYLTGKITLTPTQIKALDMNNDGKLDDTDFSIIRDIYLNKKAG